MSKFNITGNLVSSYETEIGNKILVVNEYSPSLTKDEKEFNEIIIKNVLRKAFANYEN